MVMKTMRRNFHLLKYIIWAVVIAFVAGTVLVGIDFQGGSSRDAIALVNSQPLKLNEFQNALQNRMEAERKISGSEINEEDRRQIRQEVLDEMIDETLALQNASKLGVFLGEQEFLDTIYADRSFKDVQGNFSRDLYLRFLQLQAQRGVSPQETENNIKRELLFQKLQTQFYSQAQISPLQIERKNSLLQRKIQAEILVWDYALIAQTLEVSEDQVRKFYSENRQRWLKPDQIRARHILLQPEANQNITAVEALAKEIYQKAMAGDNFEALAKKYSKDEGSAKQGGDLGFFSEKDMVPQFAKAAFALKIGEISQPVQTDFGFHIIKLEEKKKGFTPTFENSQNKAKKELLLELAREKTRQDVTLTLRRIENGESLTQVVKKSLAKTKTTNWFNLDSEKIISEFSKNSPLVSALLYLEKNEIMKNAIYLTEGAVLGKVTSEKTGESTVLKNLKEQKEIATRKLLAEQGSLLYSQWIKSLRDQAKLVIREEML
jgi:peptidyl-prolyl cis-trans isomerase D